MSRGTPYRGFQAGSLALLSTARSRSISAENPTGAAGEGGRATEGTGAYASRELGQGWKVSPCIELHAGETVELTNIEGPGIITHVWITTDMAEWRNLILRCHWDDDGDPAIEVPLGDFFCNGWTVYSQVSSMPISVNPIGGLNSYWEMPFRSRARISIEYRGIKETFPFFYQVDYSLIELPDEIAYLHAQWRRNNPLPYKQDHTILDRISGQGHYVGTYLAWGSNNAGWWGEGEMKFFMDDDEEWPTICGTGTEDYFGGAWGFMQDGRYLTYTAPYLGFHQAIEPDGVDASQTRFGMYRWHIPDPIRFETGLRVTIQALGWRSGGRYLPLRDDIASTAFFYHERSSVERPELPDRDLLEVI